MPSHSAPSINVTLGGDELTLRPLGLRKCDLLVELMPISDRDKALIGVSELYQWGKSIRGAAHTLSQACVAPVGLTAQQIESMGSMQQRCAAAAKILWASIVSGEEPTPKEMDDGPSPDPTRAADETGTLTPSASPPNFQGSGPPTS